MLKRKIEKRINKWISNENKALLVTGVRQAGKTYTIRKCLKESKTSFVEFNLIEQPNVAEIFNDFSSIEDLLLKLSLHSEKNISTDTIMFIDEVQKCKEILTKAKFLVEKKIKIIMSGSLLGVEIVGLRSAPVGYVKMLEMYPLDFEEFLQIFSPKENLVDEIKDCYCNIKQVDDKIHKRLMEIYYLYLLIGGMPDAVKKYKLTSNIDEVMQIHKDIIKLYKIDFSQYEEENRKLQISNIYEMIPAEINANNKRFKIANLNKNLRYDRISESFIWLQKSGVALSVFNVTEPKIPLLINQKSTLFKMFLSDVGLLTTIYGKACKLKIISGNKDINKGAIFENYVAQELTAHGVNLWYYNNKKYGELDFLTEQNNHCVPIEVKSGKDYERHSALNNVVSNKQFDIEKAYVLSGKNLHKKGKIVYLPIYMTMFINENLKEFKDISLANYKF